MWGWKGSLDRAYFESSWRSLRIHSSAERLWVPQIAMTLWSVGLCCWGDGSR